MTTIVSAFINNVNNNNTRSLQDYINLGSFLLKAKINKIIFIEQDTYEHVKQYENENTKFVVIVKQNNYLYNYKKLITDFNLNSNNKDKDTLEYIFTQCLKTEYVSQAILLNHFNTENFVWIDFGIKHVFNCDDSEFVQKIEDLNNKKYNKIRIGSIWNLNHNYNCNVYKNINWYFAGGVFGGNITNLQIFIDLTKEMCIRTINEKNTLMWEVNIWYLIYQEHPFLFDNYCCNHNSSLIDNY